MAGRAQILRGFRGGDSLWKILILGRMGFFVGLKCGIFIDQHIHQDGNIFNIFDLVYLCCILLMGFLLGRLRLAMTTYIKIYP